MEATDPELVEGRGFFCVRCSAAKADCYYVLSCSATIERLLPARTERYVRAGVTHLYVRYSIHHTCESNYRSLSFRSERGIACDTLFSYATSSLVYTPYLKRRLGQELCITTSVQLYHKAE